MMFNQYPYINLNDLNLDYILSQIKTMMNEVTNFVSINAIKYADPIQWDITRQYEKNTVVIDPVTGTAYISVAPVPAGVALTRTEYWTVVFDLGSFVTRAAQNFTSRWESETTLTATFPTNTGDWLVWGDVLYKALTNITAGDTYVVGSNIEHFTIEDIYNTYLNTIAAILAIIGDLTDLTTSDTSSIVNAINSVVTDFDTKIGNLATLTTTDKTSVVNAINEVDTKVKKLKLVNVRDYGAVGDGVTDDYDAFIAFYTDVMTNGYTGFIPNGHYMLSHGLNFNNESLVRKVVNGSILGESMQGVIIDFTLCPLATIDNHIRFDNISNFEMGNFTLKCSGYDTQTYGRAIYMQAVDDIFVHDIDIINCSYQGVQIYHYDYLNGALCKNLHFDNVNIYGVENTAYFPGTTRRLMPFGWVIADVEDSLVENCHIENTRWYGYEFKNYCRNSWVRNCSAHNAFTVCHIGGQLAAGDTIGEIGCGFTDISAHNCVAVIHGGNCSEMVFDNVVLYNDPTFVYSDVGDYPMQAIRLTNIQKSYINAKIFNCKYGALRVDNDADSVDNVYILDYVSLIDNVGEANTAFGRFDNEGHSTLIINGHPTSQRITDSARIQNIGANTVYDRMLNMDMLPDGSFTQRIANDNKTRDVFGVMNNYTPRIQVDHNYIAGEIRFRFTDEHNVTKDVILTKDSMTFPS